MTPCFFSPTRSSRILVLPVASSHPSLSVGTSGMPRQVRNGEPNMVDGRRRNAAARALAAERRDRPRMGQEERRLLPDARDQLVEIVGRRRALAGRDALRRRDVVESP